MPGGGAQKGERRGGRQKGTPNKRTGEFLTALMAAGCHPAEQIAALLADQTIDTPTRLRLWEVVLPHCYPQYKAIDPDGYLTVEQAAGMIGAVIARIKQVIRRETPDPQQALRILDAIQVHANGSHRAGGKH